MIQVKVVRFSVFSRARGGISPGVVMAVVDELWEVRYRASSGWLCSCKSAEECGHIVEVRQVIHPDTLDKIAAGVEAAKASPRRIERNAAYWAKAAERERVLGKRPR